MSFFDRFTASYNYVNSLNNLSPTYNNLGTGSRTQLYADPVEINKIDNQLKTFRDDREKMCKINNTDKCGYMRD